jgi:hypothetical protein
MAIYLLKVQPTEPATHLVEARTKAQALACVAEKAIRISVPTRGELVTLGAAGVKVESAA